MDETNISAVKHKKLKEGTADLSEEAETDVVNYLLQ
jgi:hypothetical protein